MAPKQPPDDVNDVNDVNDGGDLIPEPDAEPSAAELAHAKAFASLVDKTLAGRPPAAMSTDDRALLEVATVIRAVSGHADLSSARQRTLVEEALRQAVGDGTSGESTAIPITHIRATRATPATRAKRAPWVVAAASMLVAAAALVLWLRAPRAVVTTMRAPATVPETWKSRPADALIGPIGREHAGEASARLDTIFADRLDGYRERRLHGGKP